MVAKYEANASTLFVQHQQQVAGLLGGPAAIRMGGDAGQMDPPGLQFDEEQHLQPSQPDRVDGEAVAGHDPGSLLAQERLPGRGRPSWGGVEAVAAQRGADHVAETRTPRWSSSPWMRW